MKKILSSVLLFSAITISANSQKWSYDHFEILKNGLAVIYLKNEETGKIMDVPTQPVINPGTTSNSFSKLSGRQGVMITPPIRPGGWELRAGKYVPVDYTFNTGFDDNHVTVLIVEGVWSPDGKTLSYSCRQKKCRCPVQNPYNWVRKYTENSYELPWFYDVIDVMKDSEGTYWIQ